MVVAVVYTRLRRGYYYMNRTAARQVVSGYVEYSLVAAAGSIIQSSSRVMTSPAGRVQDVLGISRVESGRVGSGGWVGSGRVESGRVGSAAFSKSYGAGHVNLTRPTRPARYDLIREHIIHSWRLLTRGASGPFFQRNINYVIS